uniref:Uncharacterized protein n=1 Tax=Capra hircus TaxID=9925 RepID=A0A8C2PH99_CAPHI
VSMITKILLSSTGPDMPDLLLPVLRAQIHSEPLQEQLRTGDIATGLTSCFLCPPAWRWASPHLYKDTCFIFQVKASYGMPSLPFWSNFT